MKNSGIGRGVCVLTLGGLLLACGCGTDYCWRSKVPAEMRTVSVPTFRNETDTMELGAIAARQVLREFQREGTFKVRTGDGAALEIQGVVKSAKTSVNAYDRVTGRRLRTYTYVAKAEVSVVDKRLRKVLVNNRPYEAQVELTAQNDLTTARRDASGRLMDELARQVVDDVLNLKW